MKERTCRRLLLGLNSSSLEVFVARRKRHESHGGGGTGKEKRRDEIILDYSAGFGLARIENYLMSGYL